VLVDPSARAWTQDAAAAVKTAAALAIVGDGLARREGRTTRMDTCVAAPPAGAPPRLRTPVSAPCAAPSTREPVR